MRSGSSLSISNVELAYTPLGDFGPESGIGDPEKRPLGEYTVHWIGENGSLKLGREDKILGIKLSLSRPIRHRKTIN